MSNDKQIDIDIAVEEMASVIREITVKCGKCEYYKDGSCLKPIDMGCDINEDLLNECEALYNANFRKQSEGEWIIVEYEYVTCSECGHYHWSGCDSTAEAKERLAKGDVPNFCPNCGASMKGGAE